MATGGAKKKDLRKVEDKTYRRNCQKCRGMGTVPYRDPRPFTEDGLIREDPQRYETCDMCMGSGFEVKGD